MQELFGFECILHTTLMPNKIHHDCNPRFCQLSIFASAFLPASKLLGLRLLGVQGAEEDTIGFSYHVHFNFEMTGTILVVVENFEKLRKFPNTFLSFLNIRM